jgi:hypothetical protein
MTKLLVISSRLQQRVKKGVGNANGAEYEDMVLVCIFLFSLEQNQTDIHVMHDGYLTIVQ